MFEIIVFLIILYGIIMKIKPSNHDENRENRGSVYNNFFSNIYTNSDDSIHQHDDHCDSGCDFHGGDCGCD